MFEETAGAVQQEVEVEETVMGEGTETGGSADLFPDTPAPDRPVPAPQAHRVRITGVTLGAWPSGDAYLDFHYTSMETAADDKLTVTPPKAYASNPLVDAKTLSTEETLSQNGKKVPSEQAQYARSIRNSGRSTKKGGFFPNTTLFIEAGESVPGDGTIETIMRFAKEQGRTVNVAHVPQTIGQVVEYLNALCTGTEAVALLRAQGGDGDFADRLRTQRFVSKEYAEQEGVLKDYRRIWM